MSECKGDEECAKAAMALRYCQAGVVCPPEAAAFMAALESGKDTDKAFSKMENCVRGWEKRQQ